jgi:hypothetical protein
VEDTCVEYASFSKELDRFLYAPTCCTCPEADHARVNIVDINVPSRRINEVGDIGITRLDDAELCLCPEIISIGSFRNCGAPTP